MAFNAQSTAEVISGRWIKVDICFIFKDDVDPLPQYTDLCYPHQVLRERNEKTNDTRMKEVERENKRLTETISTKNAQMSKMEFESRQVQRSFTKLKENVDRLSELEKENCGLEKENSGLHQKVATLQHACDKLETVEQELSDLEVENRKLHKTLEGLQGAVKRKEELERENINLTVEKQKVERSLENLKASSNKVCVVGVVWGCVGVCVFLHCILRQDLTMMTHPHTEDL